MCIFIYISWGISSYPSGCFCRPNETLNYSSFCAISFSLLTSVFFSFFFLTLKLYTITWMDSTTQIMSFNVQIFFLFFHLFFNKKKTHLVEWKNLWDIMHLPIFFKFIKARYFRDNCTVLSQCIYLSFLSIR